MTSLPDDEIPLEDIITEFNLTLGRIMVPSDPNFPFGEGVRLSIGPLHFLLPPEQARNVGQGMIDTANHANEILLPDRFYGESES